jgi:hypothetical protein
MGKCLLCACKTSVEIQQQDKVLKESLLRCAMWKVLQYWGLLSKYQNDQNTVFALLWKSRDFCPDCLGVLEEIAKIHYKVMALELLIQEKVERLGRAVVERERADAGDGTLASTPNSASTSSDRMETLEVLETWKILRESVSQRNGLHFNNDSVYS